MKSDFIVFLAAAFLVFTLLFTSLTVLPIYILELGGTEFHSGLQNTLFFVAAVVLRLYFGPMGDCQGLKTPLLIGTFAFAASSILFIFSRDMWSLTCVRLFQAIGLAAFLPNGTAFVAAIAPSGRLGRYLGIYRLIITITLLAGPSGAIYLINRYNFTVWFFASFLIGITALALLLVMKFPVGPPVKNTDSLKAIAEVLKNRKLYPIFVGISLIAVCYGVILTFTSIYILEVTSIENPGIFFISFGIAAILGNLTMGYVSDHFGRSKVSMFSVFITGVGLALLSLLPFLSEIIYISSFLTGFGYAGGILALIAWLIDVSDINNRTTVLSVQESSMDISIGIGSLLVGISSTWIGLGVSFGVVGLAVLLLLPVLVKLRHS